MGTRSTISFIYGEDTLVTIYQQYDGYIDGVGHELANWLLKKKLINGIGMDQNTSEYANGIGCLAAQFIRDFKTEVGGLYITTDEIDVKEYCDYNYYVVIPHDVVLTSTGTPLNEITEITVAQWGSSNPIFKGSPAQLSRYRE